MQQKRPLLCDMLMAMGYGTILSSLVVFTFTLFGFIGGHSHPYIGILAYIFLPSVLLLGIMFVFLGKLLDRSLADKP